MSTLHTLGFGASSLGMNRQYNAASSTVSSYSSPRFQKTPASATDVIEDSKDVLVERLGDLVQRLSRDHYLKDSVVSEVHREVDNIEKIINEKGSHRKPHLISSLAVGEGGQAGDTSFWSRSRRVSSDVSSLLSQSQPTNAPDIPLNDEAMSTEVVTRIAKDAEELATKLSQSIAELRTRRDEIDHIHDLLVRRVEAGAERILFLEYRVAEMEDDFQANQSELQFLRLQLQAIEGQCNDYIPHKSDEELKESIQKWRVDWEDINRRSNSRRRRFRDKTRGGKRIENSVGVA